jgi:nicotinamidase/pyrazinamidase
MDGIKAVNLQPEDGRHAEQEMIRLGAVPVQLEMLAA